MRTHIHLKGLVAVGLRLRGVGKAGEENGKGVVFHKAGKDVMSAYVLAYFLLQINTHYGFDCPT
ncbi:MAG: hypothetical protein EAZ95_03315 [Bacteroidetes bacterium]|nr:MAG: hypothetical protein EAZ95_03315 [Bacteroidota bacterium]